jgi:hypothetical protein
LLKRSARTLAHQLQPNRIAKQGVHLLSESIRIALRLPASSPPKGER